MRLWSLHPQYLDRQALTACWREGLLAQAVLTGRTGGYKRHPQLERFRAQPAPVRAIGAFLEAIATEADSRGYRFDRLKIVSNGSEKVSIAVTSGQLSYEWAHLRAKLLLRSPVVAAAWQHVEFPSSHPLFIVIPGAVASWERPKG